MKVRVSFSNRLTTLAGAIAVTLCSGASANPPAPSLALLRNAPAIGAAVVTDGPTGKQLHVNTHAEVARYTVILKEEPVATYDGLTSGYARIPLGQKNRVDVRSAEAVKYVNYLRDRQNRFLSEAGTQLKRPLDAIMQFQHAVNGVVVELTAQEAAELAARSDVLLVDAEKMLPLMTDRSPIFIGADKLWNGSASGGKVTQGEGIVIGDIDTGINFSSPSFAGVGPIDNYQHVNPLGAGNYLGACQSGGVDVGNCNDKLIGLYNFVYSVCSGAGNPCGTPGTWNVGQGSLDVNGHGTHTSSTAAGNHASVNYSGGTFTIQGVAPHASLIEYTVCYTVVGGANNGQGSCPSTSTTAAANQAVADGIVDVLTFSIGGGSSPWTDSTSMAFLGAQNAGIYVVAAGGNSGPAAATVSHVEPWVHTVAASTDDQVFGYTFNLNGPGTPPTNTVGLPVRPGANPQPTADLLNLPITQSPGFANGTSDGCAAFASAHTFDRDVTGDRIFGDGFEGAPLAPAYQPGIAVLHLDASNSGCGSITRRGNALNAGAVGVIFVDVAYINLGASSTSYSMLASDWNNVYAQMSTDLANAKASVQLPLKAYMTAQGDVIANFSSRGPAAGIGGQAIVKPEIAAPGVAILAAYMGAPGAVGVLDGTSMATPHIAGSAALLRSLHPDWSPTQMRSAMMLTARTAGVVNQDNSPAVVWDTGSGRIDVAAAANASLTLDEIGANYLSANPATGGKIATLNLPSVADSNCVGPCTYTRTVKSAHAGAVTYTLSVDGALGANASVAPTSLLVPTGGSKSFTLTVHGEQLTPSQYTFGQITFTPSNPSVPVQHIPVAIQPGGPAIALSPAAVSASAAYAGATTSTTLNVNNIGNPTLNWSISTGASPVTLLNTTTTSNGEGYGAYANPANNYYGAQNFDVNGAVSVTSLRANGFVYPSGAMTSSNTASVTFSIYGDAPGVPTGAPQAIGAAPLWTYTAPIGGSGLSVTSGNLGLNIATAGAPPLNLGTGRYWFVPFPTMLTTGDFTSANPGWAWRTSSSAQIGNPAKEINPNAVTPAWANIFDGSNVLSALIQGNQNCTQPSWVSYAPTSGALGYGGTNAVTVTFDPTGLFAGTYNGTLCVTSNATNLPTAVAGLTFTVTGTPPTPPTLGVDFTPSSVQTGLDSTLTLTLSNANALAATLGANLVDVLPANLVATGTPNTTCAGGAGASVGSGGSSLILGKNAVIPASGSCTVAVTVSSSIAGTYTNTIPAGSLQTNAGNAAAASASLTVTGISAPGLGKSFAPTSVVVGSPSLLTITLSNANMTVATLAADLVDTFPSGMVLAAAPGAATTCTGGAGVLTTSGSITLGQNATIPANGSCTVSVSVTAAAQGSYANQIPGGALSTNFGSNATAANATLTVTPPPQFLYSNLGTDANASVLNGSTTLVSGTRYTPMTCSKLTLAQPGQQLITSFSVSLKNANAASATPTTRISFYDDSGASGGPGIKLGNTNGFYYGGGNYAAAIPVGTYQLNAAPFGYTATLVPAPTGGGNANVWACVQYSSASLSDTILSQLGTEKFANAPTAGSTSDALFTTTSGGAFTDNPAGAITSNPGSPNVFGWELRTLGNVPLVDSYQVTNAGVVGASSYSLNPATAPGKNFSGYATTISAPATSWNATGMVLYPQCSLTQAYTDVQATVQFWDTFNGSTATPVFSNSAPIASSTIDLGPVNCTANSFFSYQVRFPAPINVGSTGSLGITVQYAYNTGAGLVTAGDVTSVMNNAPVGNVPAVGTNASPGGQGWYASNSNRGDLDFQSGDYVNNLRQHVVIRVYGRDASIPAGAPVSSTVVSGGSTSLVEGLEGEPVLKNSH